MRLRRRFTFLVASLLGAAVVVLPAVAGSETAPASVTAVNSEGPYKGHYWSPSAVTVGSGGVVTFSNPSSEVSHGLEWTGGPAAPTCSGVPGAPGATSWHGECAFAQTGTYSFRCTVHPAEMTGTVTVSPTGTTTTTTSTQPAAPGAPTPAIVGAPGSGGAPAAVVGSPLAGTAATAVKLASRQRGERVRGSVLVSQAGAGGRLEVDLLANRASLAIAGHFKRARVGRIARSSLRPGRVSFRVALDARARRALHARRRLALLVELLLTPAHGSAVTITRSVLLHA